MSGSDDVTDISSQAPAASGTVQIGDVDRPISIDLLQRIYSELNGKKASIRDSVDDPIWVELDDLEQLHHIVFQTVTPYRPISFQNSFVIFYAKRTKEEFASFENFKIHSAASSRPVESLEIKYDFLLISDQNKSNNYCVTIRVYSRLSIEQRIDEQSSGAPASLIRLMGGRTGDVEIIMSIIRLQRAYRQISLIGLAGLKRHPKINACVSCKNIVIGCHEFQRSERLLPHC